MSTMGTFDAFTSARLGIYAAQHGLRVTGNNVSNINTIGYTRQRLDQVSFKAGAYDRYRSQMDNHVGSGALVMNINQVRDPYLDVRFRNVSADVGYHDTMLAGLKNIESILDEVNKGEDAGDNELGDGLLHAQIQDLRDKLLAFSKEPTSANNNLVRTAASILCGTLNSYSKKLDTLYKETVMDFNSKVTEINECLTNIRDLNREIRDCEIYGDNALELRDERNRQIDTLAQYLHIRVVYTEEDIGCGQKVEKLSIYLDDDNPDKNIHTDESMLIDGVFGTQISSPEERVVFNPYLGNEIQGLEGLKDFLYLTDQPLEDPNNAGQFLYMLDDGTVASFAPKDPAIPDTAKAIMKGTNFVEDAAKVDNDIFALEIGKLVDVNNKEWTDRKSTYEQVADAILDEVKKLDENDPPIATGPAAGWSVEKNPTNAVFKFKLQASADGWDNVNEIVIGGETVDLTGIDVQDPAELARVVAQKLNGRDPDYDITSDADGNLIYTAKTEGRVGVSGPAKAPKGPVFTPGTGDAANAKITITAGDKNYGAEAVLEPPASVTVTDPDTGVDTITSYQEINGVWNKVTTTVKHTQEVALDDNDIHGALQAVRELLTENGQFTTKDMVANVDENAASKRGIPYYQKALDLLAKEFAKQYNQLNQGFAVDEKGNYLMDTGKVDEKGNPVYGPLPDCTTPLKYWVDADGNFAGFTDPGTTGAKEVEATLNRDMSASAKEAFDAHYKDNGFPGGTEEYLKKEGIFMGGPLFSTRNDNNETEGITAGNISIAQGWTNDVYGLVPKFELLFGGSTDHSTQNTNADHMVTMIDKGLVYNPKDIVPDAVSDNMFTGDFGDMFSRINTVLGQDIRANQIDLNNSYTQWVEIDTSRDGVSGVDLNDEAMNMMQFQKAMNAAMRLMTVVDEALDRLINNTGIAGR